MCQIKKCYFPSSCFYLIILFVSGSVDTGRLTRSVSGQDRRIIKDPHPTVLSIIRLRYTALDKYTTIKWFIQVWRTFIHARFEVLTYLKAMCLIVKRSMCDFIKFNSFFSPAFIFRLNFMLCLSGWIWCLAKLHPNRITVRTEHSCIGTLKTNKVSILALANHSVLYTFHCLRQLSHSEGCLPLSVWCSLLFNVEVASETTRGRKNQANMCTSARASTPVHVSVKYRKLYHQCILTDDSDEEGQENRLKKSTCKKTNKKHVYITGSKYLRCWMSNEPLYSPKPVISNTKPGFMNVHWFHGSSL